MQVRRARDVVDVLTPSVAGAVREDLRLLISEVATNAIRHGADRSLPADPTIRIRLGVDADIVRVEVHDRGPGFEHVPRGPHAQPDSGWGVHFVHTLTERWGAGRDETGTWIVWFELRVPSPDRPTLSYGQRAVDGGPQGDRGFSGSAAGGLHLVDESDELASTG